MKKKKIVFIALVFIIMMIIPSFSKPIRGGDQSPPVVNNITNVNKNTSGPYEGRLRVYIVQPVSRWKNHDRDPILFSLLDFPLVTLPPLFTDKWDEDISIGYLDTYAKTINWSGFMTRKNIMVIAAVYDARSEIKTTYDNKGPFYEHNSDAAAAARPGETAYNTVTNNFTHTVLVDVVSTTKCPHCPVMEDALYNLSQTGKYPFYFVNMVVNRNREASWFAVDSQEGYCSLAVPEAYFDGGYEMLVGGVTDVNSYISRLNACGKRDVHQLNLSLSVTQKGLFKLQISITITNNEEVHYPLKPVAPYSPSDLHNLSKGREYTIQSHTTDPDGDDVYYMFEYTNLGLENVTESGWLGPYHSGEVVNTTHLWNETGGFIIRVRAKDIHNQESPRSEKTRVSIN